MKKKEETKEIKILTEKTMSLKVEITKSKLKTKINKIHKINLMILKISEISKIKLHKKMQMKKICIIVDMMKYHIEKRDLNSNHVFYFLKTCNSNVFKSHVFYPVQFLLYYKFSSLKINTGTYE